MQQDITSFLLMYSDQTETCLQNCGHVVRDRHPHGIALMEVPWYIGVFTRLSCWEPRFDPRYQPELLSFSKDNLSTLLFWTQVYNWGPSRMRKICYVFACNIMIGSLARNAPLGVEIVHCECGLEIAPNVRGNNSMVRLGHLRWMEMCAS